MLPFTIFNMSTCVFLPRKNHFIAKALVLVDSYKNITYICISMKDIREKIRASGLKITWLADKIGVSQPLLSMYLNGAIKNPPKDKIEKLKKILDEKAD